MNELAIFAGAGGGILGGKLLGWRTVCAVERDAYAAQVLAQRQNDRILEPFPIWSDVESFDGTPWRGIVDVVSGGFPCQDISGAGRGAGIDGKRSGLWFHMARIVREVRPRFVLVENSPMLTSRGLGRVLGDLAAMGFDAEWGVVSAADTGAPHLRERIWIVADAGRRRCDRTQGREVEQPRRAEAERGSEVIPDAVRHRRRQRADQQEPDTRSCGAPNAGDDGPQESMADADGRQFSFQRTTGRMGWISVERNDAFARYYPGVDWPAEPGLGRVANGVAHRVDRVKALGNGQVPRVAATAFTLLRKD
ncbi:DNA cytosine methyltransferase [Burkholderia gladioli]|uniref:DNA cytosine methyltransferase n=1 Tax=Burkholderia gladioli TaxID=28095 RepID=UPI001641DD34